VRHAPTPRTSSSHPREGGRRRTAAPRHAAGRGPRPGPAPAAARPAAATSHATPPAGVAQQEVGKGRCPVVSNRPLHSHCPAREVSAPHCGTEFFRIYHFSKKMVRVCNHSVDLVVPMHHSVVPMHHSARPRRLRRLSLPLLPRLPPPPQPPRVTQGTTSL
jgi:hypothetical protein